MAERQRDLFVLIFGMSAVIFVVVMGVLAVALIRFRQKPGRERDIPTQTHGHTGLEIGWTIAPALILVAITIPTIQGIGPTYDPPASYADTPAMTIEVVGHQWWWEYRYLDPVSGAVDFVTANEMHIPVDTVVNLKLMSADVIHSFSIPRLAGTRDAIPGKENRSWFIARETGAFEGQCKELCGLSHALMRAIVFADAQPQYDAWAAVQRGPAVALSAIAASGRDVFTAKGCIGCHTIGGFDEAVGVVGPNLTHFGSRTTIAANIMARDEAGANLAAWLRDPPAIKPGSKMPNLQLTDEQIASLTALLVGLK
ncbi:MAG: cytochrome c oxidase subunit II [Chloroflexi bacterium]|nr:cytochrome c oxidase subunit II [Chloroflexota bacterium]